MIKKEKKVKEKKTRAEKKSKTEKGEKKANENGCPKKPSGETIRLYLAVCGDPQAIDLFMKKNGELNARVDKYRVILDADPGNDSDGKVILSEADFFLCVYDVCDCKTVEFLKSKVIPEVRALNKKMAIAGLGLECRGSGRKNETVIGTTAQLAKLYGCKGTELICCDGHQMAAGTFSLYTATCPEKFKEIRQSIVDWTEGENKETTSKKDKFKRMKKK
ncbi:hypothetical protein TcWFU_003441 [Taenia crassiceps]|uniref:Uncharacterized protein n=1 Tax=Taenia crassiceps TaxID=6207 RepID=A0ABR4QH48_9CEST